VDGYEIAEAAQRSGMPVELLLFIREAAGSGARFPRIAFAMRRSPTSTWSRRKSTFGRHL